jgi:hypothetical protein
MAKGKLSIHRVHSGDDDYIAIEVVDGLSGTKFVQIEITPETLGNVITGLSFQECEFELRRIDLVGKKREVTHYLVPRPEHRDDEEEATALLAPFEINGWKANRRDLYNHHNWCGDDKVRVGFSRYVEVEQCDETCPSDS